MKTKHEREICLFKGLVQTERQYEFIYRVIEYFVEQHLKQSQYSPDYMNMR
jgi:hypothetical protein